MEKAVRVGQILLGKYRVERMLGRGGMGYVLAVRHLELDELFAMKLLSHDSLRNADAVARFVREARAAARLKSEHVARVVDVGHFDDGAVYIVMEHLHGRDLGEELRDRGPLPVEEAITYVLQACDAISEVHAEGFVHRDIKPGNLFLTHRPNGRPCVKVLDFGIAKHLESDDPDLTLTGVMLGSPRYMSPEQMRRTRSVDARSDVWSMGVVLFKLLTDTLPFRGDSVPEVISSVLFDEPLALSEVRKGLPIDLDSFFSAALAKEPDRRFQTIDELAQALTILRDEVWDRSSDSGIMDSISLRSSQLGDGAISTVPTTRASRPHEPYAPAIPASRASRPRGTPVTGVAAATALAVDPEEGLASTAVLGRGSGVRHRSSRPPQDTTSSDGSTRRSEIEAPLVVPDQTRIESAGTIRPPARDRGRVKRLAGAIAVLGLVAFGSAYIARACTGREAVSPGARAVFHVALAGAVVPVSTSSGPPPAPSPGPSDSATATAVLAAPSAATAAPSVLPRASASARPPTGKPPPKASPMAKDIRPHR